MAKHSIVPILEHYGITNIRDSYGWQKIKCIFHDDSHASAGVNIQANIFVCHGCGTKGDTYKVIMEKEGMGFREAYAFAERISHTGSTDVQQVRSSGRRVLTPQGNNTNRRAYRPPRRGR